MVNQITKRIFPAFLIFSLLTGIQDLGIVPVSLERAGVTGPGNAKIAYAAKKAKRGKKTKKRKRRRVRKFALNFKDVDIDEFLNIMSQLIGKNIILDDKVRGKISISSARKVPVSQAYAIMKSILEVKGLAVVESGNLIKVIPIKDAIKKNVEIIIDGKKKLVPLEDKTVTFLLELKAADAQDISRALKPLKSKFTSIVVYDPLNTVIFSGNSTEINGLVKIATALDKDAEDKGTGPKQARGNIHVLHLENADATQLAEVLSRIPFSETAKIDTSPLSTRKVRTSSKSKRISKRQAVRKTKKKSKLSIIANKDTNSLIITATPAEFKQIEGIIKELDIVREQVLIEALIIEVNASSGWGFGIDWMLGQQIGSNIFGGSQILSNLDPSSFGQTVNGKTLALPAATGFQIGFMPDTSVLGFALLNASGTDSNFNILSTPQILTVDNHEAELNVGEEIPVASNNRISDSGTQFYTYEYKSVGIKLKITPHITNKKRITLDLYQEINSVLDDTTASGSSTTPPRLGKRDIKTKVSVLDGKTIVIGGLIQNQKTEKVNKVPVLGDIPVLGWLFKHKTVAYSKQNLLIFITPHIVTKQKRIDTITRQKRESQDRLRRK